jgi:hypothetical protein
VIYCDNRFVRVQKASGNQQEVGQRSSCHAMMIFFLISSSFHAGFAHKICENDATWFKHPDTNRSWTNYTTCIDVQDFEVDVTFKFPPRAT